MRYKIQYGKGPKLDRWGHYLPDQPKLHEVFTETLEEAKKKALEISLEHKKWDINVYDLQGPALKEYDEEGQFSTWCVYGFTAGRLLMENDYYFQTIRK